MMHRIESNMKRVTDIMRGYFDENPRLIVEKKLPVRPKKSEWEYLKEPHVCLSAQFSFENADTYAYFISEVVNLEKKMSHHGVLECNYPDISIKVRTHSLDMVTKQDVKYAKKVLQILKDAKKLEELK